MKALTLISHLSMYLKGGSPQFRADLPKCISNSEAQIENGVAYKKKCISEEKQHCVSTLRHRHAKGWVLIRMSPLATNARYKTSSQNENDKMKTAVD